MIMQIELLNAEAGRIGLARMDEVRGYVYQHEGRPVALAAYRYVNERGETSDTFPAHCIIDLPVVRVLEPGHTVRIHVGQTTHVTVADNLEEYIENFRPGFQRRVRDWVLDTFGDGVMRDTTERNHRFLEEALELVQSNRCTREDAHALVDYVFDRPAGAPQQEAGGTLTTLAALCVSMGINMAYAGELELRRIWQKQAVIRAKQATKPRNSPLPGGGPMRVVPKRVAEYRVQTGDFLGMVSRGWGYGVVASWGPWRTRATAKDEAEARALFDQLKADAGLRRVRLVFKGKVLERIQ